MRRVKGRWTRVLVLPVLGSALLFGGCAETMMGGDQGMMKEKGMMKEEGGTMKKEGGMMKEEKK